MKDINGEKFQVGDSLKVIKWAQCGAEDLEVGDVVECIDDDETRACEFRNLGNGKEGFFYNYFLQKL